MDIATLRTICRARGLSQSDLACLAGVTRQAVSAWFKAGRRTGQANPQSRHLLALSRALGVAAQDLLVPLPGLDGDKRQRWRGTLLWDALYPDLDRLLVALARGDDRALARLVDRVGLYRGAKIAGPVVWRRFPAYLRYLHPMRRVGLERVWQLRESRASR